MGACTSCTFHGSCLKTAFIVGNRELASPEFRRDARNFVASLGIKQADLLDRILEFYARFDGCIVDAEGNPVRLETFIFFPTDKEIEDGEGEAFEKKIDNW